MKPGANGTTTLGVRTLIRAQPFVPPPPAEGDIFLKRLLYGHHRLTYTGAGSCCSGEYTKRGSGEVLLSRPTFLLMGFEVIGPEGEPGEGKLEVL